MEVVEFPKYSIVDKLVVYIFSVGVVVVVVVGVAIKAPHMSPPNDEYDQYGAGACVLVFLDDRVILITSPSLNCGERVPVIENEFT